jgi:hypothetical protein
LSTPAADEKQQAEGGKILRREEKPTITFHSRKSFDPPNNFSRRRLHHSRRLDPENHHGLDDASGFERIDGKMVFDRKDYGMNSGIPFIKIADHVEVTIALEAKEIKGPPLVFKQEPKNLSYSPMSSRAFSPLRFVPLASGRRL